MHVIKGNGKSEEFSEEKVVQAMQRAHIPKDMQEQVLSLVKEKLFDGITTSEIHNFIKEFLRNSESPSLVAKYNLKHAIMELGPTGYPFEDYVAKLLEQQGYSAKTRTIVRGKCVTHEIDVIATKNNKILMVEAKFHNMPGTVSDVQVVLYTQARFQDAKEQNHFDEVMVITNTKMTSDAIAYGQCMGMQVVSWNFPENNSLRDWIENLSLYPITALTKLTNNQKAQLLQNNVVLCLDVQKNPHALSILGIGQKQQEDILAEVEFINRKS